MQQSEFEAEHTARLDKFAQGRKLLTYGLLAGVIAHSMICFTSMQDSILLLCIVFTYMAIILAYLGLAISGIFKLASEMGNKNFASLSLCVLLFIPVIGIITLVILRSQSALILDQHGYRVSFMNATHR